MKRPLLVTSPPWLAAGVIALLPVLARAGSRAELSLQAGLDSAYDDNVFNGRGPDLVNRVNPRASLRVRGRRGLLEADYQFGYWSYAFGKAQDSFNHRARVGGEVRLSRRLDLYLADELARAQDPGFLSRVGVVAPQIGILDNVADLRLGYALSRRWYGSLGHSWHRASFDPYSPEQRELGMAPLYDGAEHSTQLRARYRVTRADELRLAARVQLFQAGPQGESAERWNLGLSYAPSLGWRHRLLRSLDLSAEAGPVLFQALSDAAQIPAAAGSGLTWRAAGRLRWSDAAWLTSLSYAHDLLGATGIGSAIWADHLYAQVGYQHHDRIELRVGGGYFRNGRAVTQPVAYDGFTADALVDVRVVRHLRLGCYYTLRWQRTGAGAAPAGAAPAVAAFPATTRNVVGLRLLAVLGAGARLPRREAHE